jgi:hypothetical protein
MIKEVIEKLYFNNVYTSSNSDYFRGGHYSVGRPRMNLMTIGHLYKKTRMIKKRM